MARHARQFYQLNARPFGLILDGHYADEAARQTIEQFLAQGIAAAKAKAKSFVSCAVGRISGED